ncbi:thiol protease/hemagglutinin PrtT [Bacteroides stercorirosoris]|uniref:thiol protease/hemagglutinin PrtT n=1 Tax=Bacteroides stercorirosoris TaxID=871324 RepID=UPI0035224775
MRCTLLFLFILLASRLLADNVIVEQAHALAADFFKANVQTRSATASPSVQLVWDGEEASTRSAGTVPAFYVFNSTDRKGFVIIAGDDLAMPVLGYSFTDRFVVDGMPSNLKNWMNGLREQINDAREMRVDASGIVSEAWREVMDMSTGDVVKQYETAKWDQLSPYNKFCPMINNVRTVTGCVATAMAILMRYHQWPDAGTGTLPAYTYTANINGKEISQNVAEKTLGNSYVWNNMPLEYNWKSSETTENEVAALMYDCGVMAQSQFNIASAGGTGAATLTAVQGLAKCMKYNKGMLCLRRDWYSDAEWLQMLKDEIMTVGPVLYGGATLTNEGHQFILDAYTTKDYFRVNWGGSGNSNGFFLISALNPDEQGTGGSTGGGFITSQDAVFGLKKAESDSEYQSLLSLFAVTGSYSGLETMETQFNINTLFNVKVGAIGNFGLAAFNGNVCLALVNKNLNLREIISETYAISDLQVYSGRAFLFSCKISVTPQPGDRIVAVYKGTNDADWKVVRGGADTTTEIVVKADPTPIIETKQEMQFTVFCDKQQEIVTVYLPENTSKLTLYDVNGRLLRQISSEGKETITFSCREYPTGVYILQAVTDKGTQQCKFFK